MPAGDVVRELARVRQDSVAEARRLLALADVFASRHDWVTGLFRGSRHPLVEQALAQQEGAVRRIREAAQHLSEMAQALAIYLDVITDG
ncbi:hypothetical protein GCM10022225_18240 [Plantactinospora mayteni]|uniref:Uncharacterized protein n=1 Tax=Plantactinospora mayteni TaxID=566021 RepID=A0ABQ4EMY4_9ACTN|nr:hypothetical protein [Plantactinospora mayteni]GIG96010.1 hypothetical protein Pma05_25830 [Plantactinospora mayteni]